MLEMLKKSASFSKAALLIKDYRTYKPKIVYFKIYLSTEICANSPPFNLLKFFLISVNYKNILHFLLTDCERYFEQL